MEVTGGAVMEVTGNLLASSRPQPNDPKKVTGIGSSSSSSSSSSNGSGASDSGRSSSSASSGSGGSTHVRTYVRSGEFGSGLVALPSLAGEMGHLRWLLCRAWPARGMRGQGRLPFSVWPAGLGGPGPLT